jgi:uncharacterized protein (TIGR02270 family)
LKQAIPIRWDIVEEHLDEAGFLSGLWENALVAPEYTLAEVAQGPEERLLAHLDGLVVGGSKVAERLLVPGLGGDDPALVLASAWALLLSEEGDQAGVVIEKLAGGEPEQVAAIGRAFQLALREDVPARLVPLLAGCAADSRAAVLDVLALRRADAAGPLEPFVGAPDQTVRCAGLRLARALPHRLAPHALEPFLTGDDPVERDLAIAAGLVCGARSAWATCERIVRDGGPAWDVPALLYALSGETDLGPLLAALDDPERAKAALFALGFTGNVAAAEAAAARLGDEDLGKLAGEAFTAVTGLALAGQLARPPEPWDPDAPEEDDEEEDAGPVAQLPAPDPAPVLAWWEKARKSFDPAARLLGGVPWSVEALLGALETASMRRRPALALDLAVRTRGAARVEVRALARRQVVEVRSLLATLPRPRTGTYADIMGAGAPMPRQG